MVRLAPLVVALVITFSAINASAGPDLGECTDSKALAMIIRERTGDAAAQVNTIYVDYLFLAEVTGAPKRVKKTKIERVSTAIKVVKNLCGKYTKDRATIVRDGAQTEPPLAIGARVVVLVSYDDPKHRHRGSPAVLDDPTLYAMAGKPVWRQFNNPMCSGATCDQRGPWKTIPLPANEKLCKDTNATPDTDCPHVGDRCVVGLGASNGHCSRGATELVCSGAPEPHRECPPLP